MSTPAPEASAPTSYLGYARKWRPKDFNDLVGQPQVSRELRSGIEKGRIGHAYLFSGPRGIGKTSAARILAKAINCEQGPTASPCGTCSQCRSIAAGSSMDVMEIDGASNNGVEQVRDLRENVNHVPFSARKKVYIIDEVHMLSIAAFNALLKTLEEPPAHVTFIFATTEVDRIPDTIVSRCQRYNFRAITLDDIVHRLDYILQREGVEADPAERQQILEAVALAAEGGMRDAQVALDQIVSLSDGPLRLDAVRDFLGVADQGALFAVVENIRDRQTAALLELVRDLVERGRDLERFVKQVCSLLRDLLVLRAKASPELTRLTGGSLETAKRLAGELDGAMLVNALNIFLDLEAQMKMGAQPRILLEFALMRLSAIESLMPIAELIGRIESGAIAVGGSGGSSPAPPQGPATSRPPARRAESVAESHSSHAAPVARVEYAPAPTSAPAAYPQAQAQPRPQASNAVPATSGGAVLERVSLADVESLQAMLVAAIAAENPNLRKTLGYVPLDCIEGQTVFFGRQGESISPFDAKIFEKPETIKALRETLERLTGARNLKIQVRSAAGRASAWQRSGPAAATATAATGIAPPPASPAAGAASAAVVVEPDFARRAQDSAMPSMPPAPPVSAYEDSTPTYSSDAPFVRDSREDYSQPLDDSPPANYMSDSYAANDPSSHYAVEPLPIQLSAEESRRAFGLKGMSRKRIQSLLQQDPALRDKVMLAKSIFDGVVIDGEGNPIDL